MLVLECLKLVAVCRRVLKKMEKVRMRKSEEYFVLDANTIICK